MTKQAKKLPTFGNAVTPGLRHLVGLSGYNYGCGTCGRIWRSPGGYATGFMKAAAGFHVAACEHRTPAQRRAANARDEKKWKLNPPRHADIENMPEHPGLKEMQATPR